jgi:hypothetical protein
MDIRDSAFSYDLEFGVNLLGIREDWEGEELVIELSYTLYGSKKFVIIDRNFWSNLREYANNHKQLKKITVYSTLLEINPNRMFSDLDYVEEIDLSNADLHDIKDANGMFYNSKSLKKVKFNNTFCPYSVCEMFSNCYSLEIADLECADFSMVKNVSSMFINCKSIKSVILSNLVVDRFTVMQDMFNGCDLLNYVKIGNEIMQLNTPLDSKCLDIEKTDFSFDIYDDCIEITGFKDKELSDRYRIDTEYLFNGINYKVVVTEKFFFDLNKRFIKELILRCTILQKFIDFDDCIENDIRFSSNSLEFVDLHECDMSSIRCALEMFSGRNIKVILMPESFNPKITDLMFANCESLETLDLIKCNLSTIISCDRMFFNCLSLKELNIGNLELPVEMTVRSIEWMFKGCDTLEIVDGSRFSITLKNSKSFDMSVF